MARWYTIFFWLILVYYTKKSILLLLQILTEDLILAHLKQIDFVHVLM